ncbi:DASH complex, subunit Spc19 [Xylona heveae TC161]|uniref:DASH complex subunit SPC19 n=1 Tax=Xylona heveae (strain CBS 132557 / TC161) TaxID=1328760 RepID=A0A164ZLC0_XYLHT|nr:DASH complex, subunit Spc19 [Xylona heveae TC161]KZF19238.1 DASH complex, subunit Spc19 [Xylona heveae TC161]
MSSSLAGCVASLQSSKQLLESSISVLDSGVRDFPRLSKVLQTTRHFELISESELQAAQQDLLDEIGPEVTRLLDRVSTHLDKLERRQQSLIAKAELQEVRLSQAYGKQPSSSASSRKSMGYGISGRGTESNRGTGVEALRLKHLRQKKQRLSYAVETLELQAQQRERQLRMSMAAQ